MSVPRLSHLQFLVIGIVGGKSMAGREVREQLEEYGVRQSGPAFYQLMARMEDAELVEGGYRQQIIEGQIIRERHYVVTVAGRRAWGESRDFYTKAIEGLEGTEGFAGA